VAGLQHGGSDPIDAGQHVLAEPVPIDGVVRVDRAAGAVSSQVDPEASVAIDEVRHDPGPHAGIEPVAVSEEQARAAPAEVVESDRLTVGAGQDLNGVVYGGHRSAAA